MNAFVNKYSAFVFAVSPVLAMYLILPGTNLSGFLLAIATIMIFFKYGVSYSNQTTKKLLIGVSVLSIISLLSNYGNSWFDITTYTHNLWAIALCVVPLTLLINSIKVESYIKVIYVIAILASVIALYQRVLLTVTGSFPSEFFLPLPMTDDVSASNLRPHAFFREPAHLAMYLLPVLYLALINSKKYYAVLYMLGILCSGSTTGFLLGIAVFLYWLSSNSLKRGRLLFSVAAVFVIISVFLQFAPDLISSNTEKLINTDANTSLRLLGTMDTIERMRGTELYFGIGINQLANYGNSVMGDELSNYANSVAYMLISYGIVGLICMLFYIIYLVKNYKSNRGFLLLLIGILFSDQILFNNHLVYLLSFVLLSDKLCLSNNKQ